MGAEVAAEANKPVVDGKAGEVKRVDEKTEGNKPTDTVPNWKTNDEGAKTRNPVANEKVSYADEPMANPNTRLSDDEFLNSLLNDDDGIATTLAAASEKLQAANRREQQKKPKESCLRFFKFLHPTRVFRKLRDCYINTCLMAAEKGDFSDLVAGHPGMTFTDSRAMSRNMSTRRDIEEEEMLQASLSRQMSISLSRQQSQSDPRPFQTTRNTSKGMPGLPRNASAGVPGLPRNISSGVAGLPRNASTGMPGYGRHTRVSNLGRQSPFTGHSAFGKNSSRKQSDSDLFAAGRDTFMQKHQQQQQQQRNGFSFPTSMDMSRSTSLTSLTTAAAVISESNLEGRITPEATDVGGPQKPGQ